MQARTLVGLALFGIGLWSFLRPRRTTAAAAPGSSQRPRSQSTGAVKPTPLNAHTYFEERGVLERVSGWSEGDEKRFTDAIDALGVTKQGLLTKRPPLFARQDALDLADQFDREGKDPSVGAAIRDFALASDSLPS